MSGTAASNPTPLASVDKDGSVWPWTGHDASTTSAARIIEGGGRFLYTKAEVDAALAARDTAAVSALPAPDETEKPRMRRSVGTAKEVKSAVFSDGVQKPANAIFGD